MRHLLRTLTQIAPDDMEFIYALPRPTVAIPKLQDKLEDNKITDELTHKFVSQWLEAFRDWIEQLNK